MKNFWSPTKDHMISVRTPRVLNGHSSPAFFNARMGNTEGLRSLFERGLASPFDLDSTSGPNLLHVSLDLMNIF